MARARKPKRTQVRVLPMKRADLGDQWKWQVTINGEFRIGAKLKGDAVDFARCAAMIENPSQLRIHGKDGTILEERTFPRSSDPRRTKG